MNRAEMEFQRNLCTALIENAHREDFNIAFMTSYEIRRSENTYDIYGDIIVDFAPIEQFDAIVVALDTYDMSVFREKLVRALRERAKCPVITYREKDNSFFGVLSDANIEYSCAVKPQFREIGNRLTGTWEPPYVSLLTHVFV